MFMREATGFTEGPWRSQSSRQHRGHLGMSSGPGGVILLSPFPRPSWYCQLDSRHPPRGSPSDKQASSVPSPDSHSPSMSQNTNLLFKEVWGRDRSLYQRATERHLSVICVTLCEYLGENCLRLDSTQTPSIYCKPSFCLTLREACSSPVPFSSQNTRRSV